MNIPAVFLGLIAFWAGNSYQSPHIEFNISDYSWLAGNWEGNAFGGTGQETWSEATEDGKMMGMYRHLKSDGSIGFYEFMILDQTGMKIKHYTSDFVGWEEKDKHVFFAMKKFSPDKIEMEGFIIEKVSDNKIIMHLTVEQGEDTSVQVITMTRK